MHDLAQSETSDIDSCEFEIYGEDGHGRETSTTIDITELAADALQMIGGMRQKLDEAERSECQLIGERDSAEDARADLFEAATGRHPEWSNVFGFAEAIEEVADWNKGRSNENSLNISSDRDTGLVRCLTS